MSTVKIKAPKGYRILTGRGKVRQGDMLIRTYATVWGWEPAYGLVGKTVKEIKEFPIGAWIAARKIKR